MTESAITIGKFDGYHRGHQLLLNDIKDVSAKEGYRSVCLKLEFGGNSVFSHYEDKDFVENKCGIDTLDYIAFTPELAKMNPEEFVQEVLVNKYGIRYISVGEDFRFGKDRAGTPKTLSELGEKYGFKVRVFKKLYVAGTPVSSSKLRDLLKEGNMEEAALLLGRPYHIHGMVESGKKLGRTLGYPTINLKAEAGKLLPRFGVYATEVCIIDDERVYNGITNVGIRPSVDDGTSVTIETFIYDFNDDIYGAELEIILKHFIRPERKFDSLDLLVEQIEKDIEVSKGF